MFSMGQRLILADGSGKVIADTQGELEGKQLSASELTYGAVISVDNTPVGTLIITPNDVASGNTPSGEFLASVNRAIISSAVIAGVIALILGAALFLQIIKPIQQLKKAATAIASGDLDQRVNIGSRDEIGELGSAFNQMADRLSSAETQRRHLVADVAHELRTPLAAIQGTLEGIQDGVLPFDDEQLAALYSETTLLNRLVGDLKLISLAEAGQLKLEKHWVSPGLFIEQIVERFTSQAGQKKINFKFDLASGLPDIWIDSDRVTQVLNNLITNSMRYTPEGGIISVSSVALPKNEGIQISVSDTGPGIDPSDLPYVFDRFYRSDKSRTRSSGGSGLGLAIVKQLVEAHGGSVEAESPIFINNSEPDHGTRITFTLVNRPEI